MVEFDYTTREISQYIVWTKRALPLNNQVMLLFCLIVILRSNLQSAPAGFKPSGSCTPAAEKPAALDQPATDVSNNIVIILE